MGISLYAVRMRVARLAADGSPLPGPDNLLVTDSLVRVDYEPVFNETDAITKPNGRGSLCLNVPAKKTLTGVTLTVEVCEDDPPLHELLGGGNVLTDGAGAAIVGYQLPKSDDPEGNGVSIEVWTENWSGDQRSGSKPWLWYPFPRCTLAQTPRSLSAEPDEKSFEGTGGQNAAWGNGPGNDWRWDSGAAAQWVETATPPPAVTNGYAATPAHVAAD